MKKIDRTGEESINCQGERATIIKYNSTRDLDVQFDDGTIVHLKRYDSFKNGGFKNPNYYKRIRTGETIEANNGQKMTIVAYNNADDIDVQFEDGTVVCNKDYYSFQHGEIKNPNYYKSRIGETQIAPNGQLMTIIDYRGSHDVDIQFEDGTIVKGRGYANFKNGSIEYPVEKRVGESYVDKNGQTVTITAYRNVKDIDVEFSDGTIVSHIYYNLFKTKRVHNPNIHSVIERYKSNRLRETGKNAQGLAMKIIEYNSSDNIAVEFEDGTIVKNKNYSDFLNGKIGYPNYYSKNRTGESIIAKNGQKMTIVEYRNARDLDVQFEDGTIVQHKAYSNFKKGGISKHYATCSFPEAFFLYYLQKIGFKKHKQGYFLKYNSRFGKKEIDIFNDKLMIGIEYDGFFYHKDHIDWDLEKNEICCESNIKLIRIRENGLLSLNDSEVYELFRKNNFDDYELEELLSKTIHIINEISNSSFSLDISLDKDYNEIYDFYIKNNYVGMEKYIGEINKANNGQLMEIIKYRSTKDIDVIFEDGTVIEHIRYGDFKTGSVYNPTIIEQQRIGVTATANNGQRMTIIKYNGVNSIDVQFEDGTIVKNKSYSSFKKGEIRNPSIKNTNFKSFRVGEKRKALNGQTMEITEYCGANDVSIRFEDGTIVKNKTYGAFKNGEIKNPNYKRVAKKMS
jgi:hypothetical protein